MTPRQEVKEIVEVICEYNNYKKVIDNSIERILNLIDREKTKAEIKENLKYI